MTGGQDARAAQDAAVPVSPWHGTVPELAVAGVLAAAVAAAGYAMAGWAGLSVVAAGTAATALAVLRFLLPQGTPDPARKAREKATAQTPSGAAHRRFLVQTATTSLGFYHSELRPLLEHLLAARLAERHGVNLYADPESARALLCRAPGDDGLWPWIDPDPEAARPQTAEPGPPGQRGIPPRTLARLIDRLEKL